MANAYIMRINSYDVHDIELCDKWSDLNSRLIYSLPILNDTLLFYPYLYLFLFSKNVLFASQYLISDVPVLFSYFQKY